jgi:hypothetical protein
MDSAFVEQFFGDTSNLPVQLNTFDKSTNAELPSPSVPSEFAMAMTAAKAQPLLNIAEQTASKDTPDTPTSLNNSENEQNKTIRNISPLHPAGSALRRSTGPNVVSLEAFVSTRAIKAVPTPLSGITKIGTSCPQANDDLR